MGGSGPLSGFSLRAPPTGQDTKAPLGACMHFGAGMHEWNSLSPVHLSCDRDVSARHSGTSAGMLGAACTRTACRAVSKHLPCTTGGAPSGSRAPEQAQPRHSVLCHVPTFKSSRFDHLCRDEHTGGRWSWASRAYRAACPPAHPQAKWQANSLVSCKLRGLRTLLRASKTLP